MGRTEFSLGTDTQEEENCHSNSAKSACHAKDGNESPQDRLTVLADGSGERSSMDPRSSITLADDCSLLMKNGPPG